MPSKQRFYQLDLLRFLSQIAIMLGHYALYSGSWQGLAAAGTAGAAESVHFSEMRWLSASGISMGTMVAYIIISGYGFPTMFEGKAVGDIIREKFLRIWTTFFICCSITYLMCVYVDGQSLHLSDYLFNASMLSILSGWGELDPVYWFLSLELCFYFGTILVMAMSKPEHLKYWAAALLPLSFLPNGHFLRGTLHFEWIAAYLSGVCVYLITREESPGKRKWLWLLFSTCACVAIYHSTHSIDAMYLPIMGDDFAYRKLTSGLSILAVYAFILASIFGRLNFLQRNWFRQLYGLSYSLFLLHFMCGLIVIQHWFTEPFKFYQLALLMAGLLAVAYWIYARVEPAFLRAIQSTWQMTRRRPAALGGE